MSTNNYKPAGQLVGNTSTSKAESDTASNPSSRATAPAGAHPAGTKLVGVLEGSDASTWNRAVLEVARNTDRARFPLHVRPFALPTQLTSTLVPELGTLGGTTVLDLAPAGGYDGWVYHGTVNTEDALSKLFSLRDTDGTLVLDASNVALRVASVKYVSGDTNAVGVIRTLFTGTVNQPINASDPRHRIKLAATPFATEATLGAGLRLKGCRVTISGSAPDVANQGSNNGNYVVADGTSSDTEFELAEYRHRIRVVMTAGAFASGDTVTATVGSGAVGVIAAAADVAADFGVTTHGWIEFDSITGKFQQNDTVTNGSGATGTVTRYSAPADPVLLNNLISSASYSAVFKTDGSFSRLVKVTFTQSIPGSADRYLVAGTKAFLSEFDTDGILQASTGFVASTTGLQREIAEMKGAPDTWTDNPLNILGNTTNLTHLAFADLNTAYRRDLSWDTDLRGLPNVVMAYVASISGTLTLGETIYQRSTLAGTVSATLGTATVTGVGTAFLANLNPGSPILLGTEFKTVLAVASDTSLTVTSNFAGGHTAIIAYSGIVFGTLIKTYSSVGGTVDLLAIDVTQNNKVTSGTLIGAVSLVTATLTLRTEDAHTFGIESEPIVFDGLDGTSNGLIDAPMGYTAVGVRVRADQMVFHDGDRREPFVLDGSEDYDRSNAAGRAAMSVFGLKVPVYRTASNVAISDNRVGYAFSGGQYTLTFRGNVNLTTFQANTPYTNWPLNSVLVEVYDSGDPYVVGLFLPEVISATSLKLKRLGAGGGYYAVAPGVGTGGVAKVRFWSRAIIGRGYYTDQAAANIPALLALVPGNGEVGLVIHRAGSSTHTMMSLVDDAVQRLAVVVNQSGGVSDDANYVDAPVLHADRIRSSSDRTIADINGTRFIELSTPQAIEFWSAITASAAVKIASVEQAAAARSVKVTIPAAGYGVFSVADLWYMGVLDTEGTLRFMVPPTGGDTARYSSLALDFEKNVSSITKVASPTITGGTGAEANLASGDYSSLELGRSEIKFVAIGNGVSGYPDAVIGSGVQTDTFMRLEQNSGTQAVANSVGKRQLVKVSDIQYGADYPGYTGKVIQYDVPLSSRVVAEGSSGGAGTVDMGRLWRMYYVNPDYGEGSNYEGLVSDTGAPGEGSAVWNIPPYGIGAVGGSSEVGLRYFQSAVVTCRLNALTGTDQLYLELLLVNTATGDGFRVCRKFANPGNTIGGTTSVQALTLSFEHRNQATAGGASTITLGNTDSPSAVAADNWDVASLMTGNYVGWTIETLSGTGSGQTNTVSGYTGGTRVADVSTPWGTVPDNTTVYRLYKTEWQQAAGYRLDLRVRSPAAKTASAYVLRVSANVRTLALVSAP